MTTEDKNVDFWSLTSPQLAAEISRIAHAGPASFDNATRAEASLLAAEWHDALNLPRTTVEDQETRRGLLAALQRRTIEILVHISQNK